MSRLAELPSKDVRQCTQWCCKQLLVLHSERDRFKALNAEAQLRLKVSGRLVHF